MGLLTLIPDEIKAMVPKNIRSRIKSYLRNSDKWEDGIKDEIEFWNKWVNTKPLDFIERLKPDTIIQEEIITLLNISPINKEHPISILDVGSGPLTILGKTYSGLKINITAVDVLADQYNEILAYNKITPIVKTIKGKVEELDTLFGMNVFDFVYMRNALDHSENVIKGLNAMLEVVKKKHYILLQHKKNVAEYEGYNGLHKWNMSIDDNKFIIWNKEIKYTINDIFKNIEITVTEDNGWINVIMKKIS